MSLSFQEKLSAAISGRDFFTQSTRRERLSRKPLHALYLAFLARLNRFFGLRASPSCDIHTFWGEKMMILLPDGGSLFLWGLIEGEELNLTVFLLNALKPGDVFIDAGAHFGYYTLLASELVGPQGRVYSFEPTPSTFEVLSANAKNKKNIFVHNKALWSSESEIKILDFGPQAASFNTAMSKSEYPFQDILQQHAKTARTISVQATTLDLYCRSARITPSFIKIDAEGAEFNILNGSREVLRSRPGVSLELWGGRRAEENASRIIRFMEGYSYGVYSLKRGELVPCCMDLNSYYTNLIFLPR